MIRTARTILTMLIIASVVLTGIPFTSTPVQATSAEYPGQNKMICDFESYANETGPYGLWSYSVNSTHVTAGRTLSTVAIHGSNSMHFYGSCSNFTDTPEARYEFISSVEPLLIATPTIHYFIPERMLPPGANETSCQVYLVSMTLAADGSVLRSDNYEVIKGEWTSQEFDIWEAGAASYYIAFVLYFGGFMPTGLWIAAYQDVYVDWMTAKSAASAIRISYFNQFTGLGLNSELLIPEVTWSGSDIRVWNNEMVIAYGEQVTVSVKDYFNHVFLTVTFIVNSTAVYVDVPVPLCKVYISQPDWYNSTLPPEWGVTYLPTGERVAATGWELELISGWYQFDWEGNDVLAAGELQAYVDGNATHRSSYSMHDFSLELNPTWSDEGDTGISYLGGGQFSFENMSGFFGDILDIASVIYESQEFRLISVIGVALMIVGWAISAKRKAAQMKEEEANRRPERRKVTTE